MLKKGYLQGKNSIHVVTIGDYNDHAVAINKGAPSEVLPEGGHDAFTEITINSGKVKLSSPSYGRDNEPEFTIGAGVYKLTIRSLNSGKEDPDAVKDIEDQDFFKLEHLERYELYFEPQA